MIKKKTMIREGDYRLTTSSDDSLTLDENYCLYPNCKICGSEDSYEGPSFSSDDSDSCSKCKICGSENCIEDDCEKYLNQNYITNLFDNILDCFGRQTKKNIIYRIIPKNHKRIKYKILYELGTTLWK